TDDATASESAGATEDDAETGTDGTDGSEGDQADADASDAGDAEADPGASEDDGTSGGQIALFVVIGLAVIGGVTALVVRMRRQQCPPGHHRTGSAGSEPAGSGCPTGRRCTRTVPWWWRPPAACSRCIPGPPPSSGSCAPLHDHRAPPRRSSTPGGRGCGDSTTPTATSPGTA